MTRAAIALGSNLGDRREFLRSGADALTELGTIVAVSSLYEAAPVGGPEQDSFFNAVIVIDTGLGPRELLDELHRIEAEAGRVREVRWGPRRLDLDLILFGTRRAEEGGMVVPHPRFAQRRFVLAPLVEAWPDARTPEGQKVADYLPGISDQEVISLGPWWPETDHAAEPDNHEVGEVPPETGSRQTALTFAARGGWWVVGQAGIGVSLVVSVLLFDHTIVAGSWAAWLGIVLLLAGVIQTTLGLLHLGVSLTPYPEPLQLGNLVHGGIYRYVRHPVYGGLTLAMFGLAVYQLSWIGLVVAAGSGLFFWLKAGFEERRLLAKYPEYLDYRVRTRFRIIPWVM
jgi:2-amino-4-hydroxy-6-hydroxymethyldihydropteridine diphosphokinase